MYSLIIFVLGLGNDRQVHVEHVRFETLALCERAIEQIRTEGGRHMYEKGRLGAVDMFCVKTQEGEQ